jgi:hypothetical protein
VGLNAKTSVKLFEINVPGMADVLRSTLDWEDDLSRLLATLPFEAGRYFAFLQDPGQVTEATLRANSVTRSLEARWEEVHHLVWDFIHAYMQASTGRIALIHSWIRAESDLIVEIPRVPYVLLGTNDGSAAYVSYMIGYPIDRLTIEEALRLARSWTPRVVLSNPNLKDLPGLKDQLPLSLVERIVKHTEYVMTDILDNATRLIWERPGLADKARIITRLLEDTVSGKNMVGDTDW